jgi:hypothetical protein
MALRRPPTRIELKSDDIDEYEQVSTTDTSVHTAFSRVVAGANSLTHTTKSSCLLFSFQLKNETMMASSDTAAAKDDAPNVKPRRTVRVAKKKTATERIGITGTGGRPRR